MLLSETLAGFTEKPCETINGTNAEAIRSYLFLVSQRAETRRDTEQDLRKIVGHVVKSCCER